jgi:cytochrome c
LTLVKADFPTPSLNVSVERESTMRLNTSLIAFTAVFLVGQVSVVAAGDAAAGAKVFTKCKTCHEVAEPKNKVGPTLKGLFGRKAGTVEGFKYSDAMKNSGMVWSEETLKPYLADPKKALPGGKMAFVGLKKVEDIEDVIAYLMEATK